jgi:hypothetical protein
MNARKIDIGVHAFKVLTVGDPFHEVVFLAFIESYSLLLWYSVHRHELVDDMLTDVLVGGNSGNGVSLPLCPLVNSILFDMIL